MTCRGMTSMSDLLTCAALFWLIVGVLPWSAAVQVSSRSARLSNRMPGHSVRSPSPGNWRGPATCHAPGCCLILKGESSSVFLPRTGRFMVDIGRFHAHTVSYGSKARKSLMGG